MLNQAQGGGVLERERGTCSLREIYPSPHAWNPAHNSFPVKLCCHRQYAPFGGTSVNIINPQHMCESYGSHSVCVCVCVCVTTLAATYLIRKSMVRCYKVPYGICIVWISLKTLVLQFWRHLLTTAALHALWEVLDGQEDSTGPFSRYKVCSFSDSSCKLTNLSS